MKTTYYRVENSKEGAYGFKCDGTILAVNEQKSWLLTDEWCGYGVEGKCYRQHVSGKRKPWPKNTEINAIDKTSEFDEYFADCEYPVYASELDAQTIRNILKI